MTKTPYLLCDLHTHTTYSDGNHTPREMTEEAYARGMHALGISTHSYTWFDESYCIMPDRTDAYLSEIAALRREYEGKLLLFAGVEQDYWSVQSTEGFDYVIGSVHYVRAGDTYYAIDHRRDILLDAAKDGFGGDIYALIEEYYRTVGDLAARVKPDLIGHFDVITKFNEQDPFFDETHPRYLAARGAALERLIASGIPFEVNTGGISRGYKTTPYPDTDVLAALRARGGEVLPTSDSHTRENLCFAFDSVVPLLSEMGFDLAQTETALLNRILSRKA